VFRAFATATSIEKQTKHLARLVGYGKDHSRATADRKPYRSANKVSLGTGSIDDLLDFHSRDVVPVVRRDQPAERHGLAVDRRVAQRVDRLVDSVDRSR
jgi:hypothetical protein